MKQMGKFMAGTSGLVLTEPNKQAFPENFKDHHRLFYYASLFNSIEINSSFYKIPRCKTNRNWASLVPPDFTFTLKLWKGITHVKEYDHKDLVNFFEAADCLADKKGSLLIQFPATTEISLNGLENLLKDIKTLDPNGSWKPAIEFRHARWYHQDLFCLLDEYAASLVLHDMPNSIPDRLNDKAPFIYLRFHGSAGDYRGSYENDFLFRKSVEIRQWLQEGKDVYAYFNNTIGEAAANLNTIKAMVESESEAVN